MSKYIRNVAAALTVSLSTAATAQTNPPKPNAALNRDLRPVTPIAALASLEKVEVVQSEAALLTNRIALFLALGEPY